MRSEKDAHKRTSTLRDLVCQLYAALDLLSPTSFGRKHGEKYVMRLDNKFRLHYVLLPASMAQAVKAALEEEEKEVAIDQLASFHPAGVVVCLLDVTASDKQGHVKTVADCSFAGAAQGVYKDLLALGQKKKKSSVQPPAGAAAHSAGGRAAQKTRK